MASVTTPMGCLATDEDDGLAPTTSRKLSSTRSSSPSDTTTTQQTLLSVRSAIANSKTTTSAVVKNRSVPSVGAAALTGLTKTRGTVTVATTPTRDTTRGTTTISI